MQLLNWGKQFFRQTLLIFLSFCAAAAIGMVINPQSFQKFFALAENVIVQVPTSRSLSYYWDIQPYADLALNLKCSAFYPLWPSLIHWLYRPSTIHIAARGFLITATALFVISLPLSLLAFRTALKDHRLALGVTLLYTLSPLAIFRVIGYTESLFGLASLGLLFLLVQSPKQRQGVLLLPIIILLAAILSLTRPALIQIAGAAVATPITLFAIEALRFSQTDSQPWLVRLKLAAQNTYQRSPLMLPISISLLLGALLGYAIYGLFCWNTSGNFWQPFLLQQSWNKSLGFRPWLLLSSRSPLIDLLGLYLPLLCCVVAFSQAMVKVRRWPSLKLYGGGLGTFLAVYPPLWILLQAWGNRSRLFRFKANLSEVTVSDKEIPNQETPYKKTPEIVALEPTRSLEVSSSRWLYSYGFWFALYFAAAHSAIALLTQDRLVSLGRYIFAQPFIFLTIGYLYPDLNRRLRSWLLPMLCVISALCLVEQWISYGHHKWLG
jgi:hypothetical protein